MIVVVLSVTPEKLRGELTRWLLEVSAGVYIGHLSARVRERLWLRIVEDVGRGRALMVWSARNEQRLRFQVHNHGWTVEDFDGIALMRRRTGRAPEEPGAGLLPAAVEGVAERGEVEGAAVAGAAGAGAGPAGAAGAWAAVAGAAGVGTAVEGAGPEGTAAGKAPGAAPTRTWSLAGRRRRFPNAVEQRHRPDRAPGTDHGPHV